MKQITCSHETFQYFDVVKRHLTTHYYVVYLYVSVLATKLLSVPPIQL